MYNKPRVIPVLSIIGNDLVKTTQFENPRYLGDPVNAVKIFNGKGVDELIITDIRATKDRTPINFDLLTDIASQAFMPLGYGGGIQTLDDAKKLFRIGYEKLVFSTLLFENPELIKACVHFAGSQSIVGCLDIKKIKNVYKVFIKSGTTIIDMDFNDCLKHITGLNIGEIILHFIDRENQMQGYDLEFIKHTTSITSIPLLPLGGAGTKHDFSLAIQSGAHGVCVGSMFVFYGSKKAVLISYIN
jgi:cyclase